MKNFYAGEGLKNSAPVAEFFRVVKKEEG